MKLRIEVEGSHRMVEAQRTETPGLVVHEGIGTFWEMYGVTHEVSGLTVGHLPTRAGALAFAKALGACGDWTRPVNDILADAAMRMAAVAVRRAAKAHSIPNPPKPGHPALTRTERVVP